MQQRVLIVGYRSGISDALNRLGIAHGVWHNKPLKTQRPFICTVIQEFPRSREQINSIGERLQEQGPFTHVIAGSEAAVFPASVLRRHLGARRSKNTIVLRCHDKLLMKEFLQERKVPMTRFLPGDQAHDPEDILRRLGTPVVVKSRQESGGRRIVFAEDATTLRRHNNRNRLLERYIDAPEASVESFVNNYRIQFESITQYYVKRHVNVVPGQLTPVQQQALLALNRHVIAALGINWGITHMEAYLAVDGVLFGEIALRPPGGYLMDLLSHSYGFSSWDALVAMELDLAFTFPQHPQRYSAACIFHPGEGVLRRVDNWEQALARPSVYQSRLKLEPGALIEHRSGVGEDTGYLLLSADSGDQLLSEVDWTLANVRFVIA